MRHPVLTVLECTFRHWTFLCASRSERFGEAAHPGPGFTIGTFNPIGLGAKHGVVAQLEPGISAVTETHLTHRGLQDLRTGLKLGGTSFSFCHGHAVQPRARSPATGAYQGVGFLSSFPSWVVAQSWPPEIYQTSRVQVASFLVGDVWILGGVCYGFATDKSRTGPILDAVLDRILSQPVGPRFVAGDWNLEVQEYSGHEVSSTSRICVRRAQVRRWSRHARAKQGKISCLCRQSCRPRSLQPASIPHFGRITLWSLLPSGSLVIILFSSLGGNPFLGLRRRCWKVKSISVHPQVTARRGMPRSATAMRKPPLTLSKGRAALL